MKKSHKNTFFLEDTYKYISSHEDELDNLSYNHTNIKSMVGYIIFLSSSLVARIHLFQSE